MSRQEPLWTRVFTLMTTANFGASTIFYMTSTTMAAHAMGAYGSSEGEAGAVASIFFIGAMLGRAGAGKLIDNIGLRNCVIAGSIMLALTTFLYFLPTTAALMMVVRALNGLAFGIASTSYAGAAMTGVPPMRRGEGSGFFTVSSSVPTGLAPFIGIALLNGSGANALFVAASAIGVFSLLMAGGATTKLPARPDADERSERRATSGRGINSYIDSRAIPIAVIVTLCAFPFSTILTFLNTYAEQAGFGNASQTYFLIYAVAVTVTRPIAGRLQDLYGNDVVLFPTLTAMAAGVVLTGLAPNIVVLYLAGALVGFGYGTLISAGQAIAVGAAGQERAGMAIASFFLFIDAGTGLGPMLMGLVAGAIGLKSTILVSAGFVVVAFLGYLHYRTVHGKGRPQGDHEDPESLP